MPPVSLTSWFDRFSPTCYRPHAMKGWLPVGLAASTLFAVMVVGGCGGDVELDVTHSDTRKRIAGTVELPNGELASASSLWQRIAGLFHAEARALTGNASRVGAGVRVELVRMSRENAAAGDPGELVDAEDTVDDGTYAIILPQDTDANTCRFLVQVGSDEDGTLTRAFVYNNTGPIRIDFRSEATVRLVLDEVPPADFCNFDAADLANILAAVDATPGDISADSVQAANASATAVAGASAGVQAAIDAALVQ